MHSKLIGFFSTNAAKKKLQTGSLSQTEIFTYFYLITLFDSIGMSQLASSMIEKTATLMDYFSIWLNPALGVIGFILLFMANGGSKGKDFLNKYFTFSFTVGIKYFAAFIVLEYLPNYFPVLNSNYYELPVNILMNVIMLINIGFRIFQTKS